MKQEMMNMLLSAGPNLKLQSQTNSRQHSLTEKLLSSLLFIVSAENPPVIQSTNIYISKKLKSGLQTLLACYFRLKRQAKPSENIHGSFRNNTRIQ